jgi:hypothetical protein
MQNQSDPARVKRHSDLSTNRRRKLLNVGAIGEAVSDEDHAVVRAHVELTLTRAGMFSRQSRDGFMGVPCAGGRLRLERASLRAGSGPLIVCGPYPFVPHSAQWGAIGPSPKGPEMIDPARIKQMDRRAARGTIETFGRMLRSLFERQIDAGLTGRSSYQCLKS